MRAVVDGAGRRGVAAKGQSAAADLKPTLPQHDKPQRPQTALPHRTVDRAVAVLQTNRRVQATVEARV